MAVVMSILALPFPKRRKTMAVHQRQPMPMAPPPLSLEGVGALAGIGALRRAPRIVVQWTGTIRVRLSRPDNMTSAGHLWGIFGALVC